MTCLRQIAAAAAEKGHLSCLQYVLQLDNRVLQSKCTLQEAAVKGGLGCVEFLDEAGLEWDGTGPEEAALKGDVHVLRFLLDHVQPDCWDRAMRCAIYADSPECMLALYDAGFLQQRCLSGAKEAIEQGHWRCARVTFEHVCAKRAVSVSFDEGPRVYSEMPWLDVLFGVDLPISPTRKPPACCCSLRVDC